MFWLLFVIFAVLKIIGLITWSWIWVTSPLWIGAILWVLWFTFLGAMWRKR